jgi:hypothetical protein
MAGALMELGPIAGGNGDNNQPPRPVDFEGGEYGGPDRRRPQPLAGQYVTRYGHTEAAGVSPLDLEKALHRRRTDAPVAGGLAIEGFRFSPD